MGPAPLESWVTFSRSVRRETREAARACREREVLQKGRAWWGGLQGKSGVSEIAVATETSSTQLKVRKRIRHCWSSTAAWISILKSSFSE